jgi:hypothetical protein
MGFAEGAVPEVLGAPGDPTEPAEHAARRRDPRRESAFGLEVTGMGMMLRWSRRDRSRLGWANGKPASSN